jgi:DNA-binding response OmpR family regulator
MGKAKVLLIDDSKDFVEATSFQLEHEGYDVSVAYDGSDGLVKALNELPDLIILDLKMPGIGGFEVLSKLKNNSKTVEVPVIMLTAMADTKFVMEAKAALATDYVIKPHGLDKLMGIVGKHIALSKAKKETRKQQAKTCWEYWNCPKEDLGECPHYTSDKIKPCWMHTQHLLPLGRRSFARCTECPWHKKLNPAVQL